MNIYFRVDSNSNIGTGHFSRCIALADNFRNFSKKIFFITEKIDEKKKFLLKKNKIKLKIIKFRNLSEDAKETSKIVSKNKNSYLISDGYKFNIYWQRKIKIKKINLITINDYNLKIKNIKNINPSQNNFDFKKKNYGVQLIRRSFFCKDYFKRFKNLKNNKIIIISFGASDSDNYTQKICEHINFKRFKDFKFFIILGEYYKFEKELKNLTYNEKNVFLIKNNYNLASIFKKTRLAIASCGVISKEVINFGIPSIIFKIADNQKFNFKFYKKKKIFTLFENILNQKNKAKNYNNLINKKLEKFTFNEFLRIISCINLESFNQLKYFLFDIKLKNIFLRKASKQDFLFLFNLVNQNRNRLYSFKKKEVSIIDHYSWFKKKVLQNKTKIYILTDLFQTKLGQIRFERKKESFFIDYSIDERFYNQGLGKKIIDLGLSKFKSKDKIYADVLKTNIRSNKIFKKYPVIKYSKYNRYILN